MGLLKKVLSLLYMDFNYEIGPLKPVGHGLRLKADPIIIFGININILNNQSTWETKTE